MTRRHDVVNGSLGLMCSVGDHERTRPLTALGLKRLHAVEPGEHSALCNVAAGGLVRRRWNTLHQSPYREQLKAQGYRFCAQCTRLAKLRDAARAEAVLLARITGNQGLR